jgi:hypothetical protein
MIKDTDIAWAAGFIDGEGCIYINRKRHHVRLSAYQKVPEPIYKLNEIFSQGAIHNYERKTPTGKLSAIWTWTVNGKQAKSIIELLLPYLVVKRAKAKEALDYQPTDLQRYSQIYSLHSSGCSFGHIGKLLGISRQRAHQLYRRFAELNFDYDELFASLREIDKRRILEVMTNSHRNKGRPKVHRPNWGGKRDGAGRPKIQTSL